MPFSGESYVRGALRGHAIFLETSHKTGVKTAQRQSYKITLLTNSFKKHAPCTSSLPHHTSISPSRPTLPVNNRFIFSLKTIKPIQAMRLCHFNFILKIFLNQNYFICTRNSIFHTQDLKQSIFKYNNSCRKPLAFRLSDPYREKSAR